MGKLKEDMKFKSDRKKVVENVAFDDNFQMPQITKKKSFSVTDIDDSTLMPNSRKLVEGLSKKHHIKSLAECFCDTFEVEPCGEDCGYDAFKVNEAEIPQNMQYTAYKCDALDDNSVRINWTTKEPFGIQDAKEFDREIYRMVKELLSSVLIKDFVDDELKVYVVVDDADGNSSHNYSFKA